MVMMFPVYVCMCMRAHVNRVPGAILGRPGHIIETGMTSIPESQAEGSP